jgi:hypothetical protein
MATTTNYNWSTPDDTSLVKDGAAAIRTLGSSIDTTTKALNPETTLGDISYRSATANTKTRLGIGTTGQVLTVSGGVPTWASPAGGGKVLQVVNAVNNTFAQSTTTTYADTGLTATITPTSSTSKVLVLVTQDIGKSNSNSTINLKLLRGSTNLIGTQAVELGLYTSTLMEMYSFCYSMNYLDSPATTSATTYKTQFAVRAGGTGAVFIAGQGSYSTITLLEIGA